MATLRRVSERLVQSLEHEGSLMVKTRPAPVKGVEQADYTASTAEAAVKDGAAPVALIIEHGFGDNPIAFGPGAANRPSIRMLQDTSDMVAPQVVAGLLQKVAMTSMPDLLAEHGSKYFALFAGGLTPEQQGRLDQSLRGLGGFQGSGNGGIIAVTTRSVVGENKNNPMVSFYAAAIEQCLCYAPPAAQRARCSTKRRAAPSTGC